MSPRQVRQGVYGCAVPAYLEMELRLPLRSHPHGRNDLTLSNGITLYDREAVVVSVCAEIGVVVLDDNQLPVPDQSVTGIHDQA